MIGVIDVPYWWHATLLEILWLVGGLVSLAVTALNLRDAWKDNEVLAKIRFDPAIHETHYKMIAISAHGRLESQAFRFVISLLIVGAGVVGVTVRNPLAGSTTWTGFAVSGALVGISILTAVKAWFDFSRSDRLYELAKRRTDVIAAGIRATHPD